MTISETNVVIRILDQQDHTPWNEYINQYDETNFFHSPWVASIFTTEGGYVVYPIAACVGERIVAFALAVLVPSHLVLPLKLRSRLILYASPLYEKSAVGLKGMESVLSTISAIAQNKSLFVEIRNTHPFPDPNTIELTQHWQYLPYQNYLIDLAQGPERLWKSFSPFVRNHVNRSNKSGAEAQFVDGSKAIESIDLICRLYKSKKIPMLHRSVFKEAANTLISQNILKVLICEYQEKVIATRWCLAYGKIIYDWYAGTDYRYGKLYPNELLSWKIMEWGSVNGYSIFDFGGAGMKGIYYGPAKFKEKFHGNLVEYGRWRRPTYPLIYRLAKILYELRTENE